MTPVSKTAFYCTGVRALDARRPTSICGDQFAERFMDDEAWRVFAPFRQFTGPNVSNAARARSKRFSPTSTTARPSRSRSAVTRLLLP